MGEPAEKRIRVCLACIAALAVVAVVAVAIGGFLHRSATRERVQAAAGRRGAAAPRAANEHPSARPDRDAEPAPGAWHQADGTNATTRPRISFSFSISVTRPAEPQWQLDSLLMTTNPVCLLGSSFITSAATERKATFAYWSNSAYPPGYFGAPEGVVAAPLSFGPDGDFWQVRQRNFNGLVLISPGLGRGYELMAHWDGAAASRGQPMLRLEEYGLFAYDPTNGTVGSDVWRVKQ